MPQLNIMLFLNQYGCVFFFFFVFLFFFFFFFLPQIKKNFFFRKKTEAKIHKKSADLRSVVLIWL
nr:ATP synthase subunit 8 [Psammocora nierstraszi]